MPPIYLLIKPASSLCDMRCSYCFYCDVAENRQEKSYGIMTLSTLEAITEKALAQAEGSCSFAYQGGEPTTAGLDFFKAAISFQKKHNQKGLKIHNLIQTNGYGLNDSWAAFFKKHDFLVGISLDGTKDTHDAFRLAPGDKPTFYRVMEAIGLLKKHRVEFNILTVITSQTARHIAKIYEFYKREGFTYLQFIPCLQPFGKETERYPFTLTPKAYGKFLKDLFSLWQRDVLGGKEIHIRQFENYVEMLLGYPPESCGMSGICTPQHVVEANGEVYPCDFYVTDDYRLGNLVTDSFEDLAVVRKGLGFIETSCTPDPACKSCPYFPICRGGCKRYREPFSQGQYQRNSLCPAYQEFFQAALPDLQRLARLFATG